LASDLEKQIASIPNLFCGCCALEKDRCPACLYATGFHVCRQTPLSSDGARRHVWRKGTLHDGSMDFQRVLWNLHRRGVPTEALFCTCAVLVLCVRGFSVVCKSESSRRSNASATTSFERVIYH